MAKLEFVIQSLNTSDGTIIESPRLKRAKQACLACQAKKVKCSGTSPCDFCFSRNLTCIFKDQSSGSKSVPANSKDEDFIHKLSSNGKQASTTNNITQISPILSRPETIKPSSKTSKSSTRFSAKSPTKPTKTSKISKSTVKTTRQPYFRWLGPTAIAPPANGTFRLLSINLRSKDSDENRKSVLVEKRPSDGITPISGGASGTFSACSGDPLKINDISRPSSASRGTRIRGKNAAYETIDTETTVNITEASPDVDTRLPLPSKEIYTQFGLNMSNYLPYLPWEEFESRLSHGVIGECMLFAMASLSERLNNISSARYSNVYMKSGSELVGEEGEGEEEEESAESASLSMAERYSEAAKRLILPHLASPSIEIVYTLLLIAYCEFADDRDSGLWAWSGMAIRMCYDLGLHTAQNQETGDGFQKKVFWAVVCLDRLISCGTGRNATIPDEDIEYELENSTVTKNGVVRSDPFPYFCRLLILLGKVSNFINSRSRKTGAVIISNNAVSPESIDAREKFVQFQHTVSDFYTTLPEDLLFDVENFQEYTRMNQAQVFLLLHVWNQALVLAVHHPTLVYPKFKLDIASIMSNPHAGLTGTGAISVADMVAFADLIESKSFMANPFLSQPLHMAASAALVLWHTLPPSAPSHSIYTLQRTYNTCRKILDRMQKIWRGISWHSRTLDSLAASEPDVDLSTSAGYIITKDLGLVRNATIDETTRRWLVNEIEHTDSNDIYGLFISGTIDEDKSPEGSQGMQRSKRSLSQSQAASDNDNVNLQSERLSVPELESVDPLSAQGYTLPVRRGFTQQELREEDTFRSFLMRNLDEYL